MIASDPPLPPHDLSAEIVTPIVNPKPCKIPPNLVPNVPADPDSDPSLSDFSSLESSDSSDEKYYKQRWRAKKDRNKRRSKTRFDQPINKCANLTYKILTTAYKLKVIRFKLDKDPLQFWVYFLSFMNSLKNLLSHF